MAMGISKGAKMSFKTKPGLTMKDIPYELVLMALTLRQQWRLRKSFLNEKKER